MTRVIQSTGVHNPVSLAPRKYHRAGHPLLIFWPEPADRGRQSRDGPIQDARGDLGGWHCQWDLAMLPAPTILLPLPALNFRLRHFICETDSYPSHRFVS